MLKMINKVLFRNRKKYYWTSGDLHTDAGVVREEDLKKDCNTIKAHSDKEFQIVDAKFLDRLEKIKKGPQSMMVKDVYSIIGNTGVGPNSVVLDCGVGCGVMSACLSRTVKKVVAYERNSDTVNLAKKNFESLNVKVEVENRDIMDGIDGSYDLIVLDLPDADKVKVYDNLNSGGYLVGYLPSIVQVQKFVESFSNLKLVNVIENLERSWFVEGYKVRPKSPAIMHTAFLVFMRKI